MYPAARSFSFRPCDFFERRWRLPARLNFTFPVAVNLKRFAAAFFVLSFIDLRTLLQIEVDRQEDLLEDGIVKQTRTKLPYLFDSPPPMGRTGMMICRGAMAAAAPGFLDPAGAKIMISFLPSSFGFASTIPISFTLSARSRMIL